MIYLLLVFFDQILKFSSWKFGLAVINRGIAFGLFSSKFSQLTIVISLCLIFVFMKLKLAKNNGKINPAVMLIVTGGLSNLFDRIFYGGVIDYIYLPLIPSFNLADLMISLGFLSLILNFCCSRPN